jgi:hypothetical protein
VGEALGWGRVETVARFRGRALLPTLALGPIPSTGEDEVFKHYISGKETFRIKAEKVPNAAGIRRVICAQRDPSAEVSGAGIAALEKAGVAVQVGMLADQARWLNAPYLKLVTTGRPWVIAKWAMSLDGKIATRRGDSKWISNEASRRIVHELDPAAAGQRHEHRPLGRRDAAAPVEETTTKTTTTTTK